MILLITSTIETPWLYYSGLDDTGNKNDAAMTRDQRNIFVGSGTNVLHY